VAARCAYPGIARDLSDLSLNHHHCAPAARRARQRESRRRIEQPGVRTMQFTCTLCRSGSFSVSQVGAVSLHCLGCGTRLHGRCCPGRKGAPILGEALSSVEVSRQVTPARISRSWVGSSACSLSEVGCREMPLSKPDRGNRPMTPCGGGHEDRKSSWRRRGGSGRGLRRSRETIGRHAPADRSAEYLGLPSTCRRLKLSQTPATRKRC
jgi:hypothetical protein